MVTRAEYGNQAAGYYGNDVMGQFRSLDRNHDGVLTRSESRMSSSEFNRVDDNDDGVLTLKEYRQVSVSEVGDQFDVLDRNHDGQISRGSIAATATDFERMDRDNDGVLSRERVRPALERRLPGLHPGPRGGRRGSPRWT